MLDLRLATSIVRANSGGFSADRRLDAERNMQSFQARHLSRHHVDQRLMEHLPVGWNATGNSGPPLRRSMALETSIERRSIAIGVSVVAIDLEMSSTISAATLSGVSPGCATAPRRVRPLEAVCVQRCSQPR